MGALDDAVVQLKRIADGLDLLNVLAREKVKIEVMRLNNATIHEQRVDQHLEHQRQMLGKVVPKKEPWEQDEDEAGGSPS